MDLIDRLEELAARIKRQIDQVKTEQAVKTAFVLPFIQALGYDIFNPAEVIPELTTDHGIKKGEKIDYAIKINEKIIILLECKQVNAPLESKHASQLFRYFTVTESRFGVLTDGIKYVFFSDLEKENKMDDRPFFEFNLLQFNDTDVEELKKFTKASFNMDTIISTASNLKYMKALLGEIRKEFSENPSEEIVRVFVNKVYEGKITQKVNERFTDLTKKAFDQFLKESINAKLKTAFESQEVVNDLPKTSPETVNAADVSDSDIITTPEEIDGHRIIQAIGAEIVSVERIVLRDAKSYCAILFDDNNRKPICRFYFNRKKLAISVFSKEGEKKHEISKISDIFKFKNPIMDSIKQYVEENGGG